MSFLVEHFQAESQAIRHVWMADVEEVVKRVTAEGRLLNDLEEVYTRHLMAKVEGVADLMERLGLGLPPDGR
jgi:hypothetical protein